MMAWNQTRVKPPYGGVGKNKEWNLELFVTEILICTKEEVPGSKSIYYWLAPWFFHVLKDNNIFSKIFCD